MLRRDNETAIAGSTAPGLIRIGVLIEPYLADLQRRMRHMGNQSETNAARSGPGNSEWPEVNEARLIGKIATPPTLKAGTTAQGNPYKLARLTLEVHRNRRNASKGLFQETDLIPVVLWDALAEAALKAGTGTTLRVTGRIKTSHKEKGHPGWEVKADTLQVLDMTRASKPR